MQLARLARGFVLDYWAIISGMPFSFSCFPVFSVTFENFAIVCRHDGFFLRISLPALCEIHLIIILKNDFNMSQVHSKFVMLFDKSMTHNDSCIILFYIDGVNFSLKCFLEAVSFFGYLSPEGMLRGAPSLLQQTGSFFHGEDKVYSYVK